MVRGIGPAGCWQASDGAAYFLLGRCNDSGKKLLGRAVPLLRGVFSVGSKIYRKPNGTEGV
jgi:hypothetical protein